jgi:SAM-dependent methyltransferase
MSSLAQIFVHASQRARSKRAAIFCRHFGWVGRHTRILDLGSEDGRNIHNVLSGLDVTPANVHIADIDARAVRRGHETYGFTPIVLSESDSLPFPDHEFDVVYCSSVIEHVTVPKSQVWSIYSGRTFRERAWVRQLAFANEIRRVSKSYFVQTPNLYFPVESHTWLPFVGYLPRPLQLATLGVTNRVWIKRTAPDWNLLGRRQMRELFPDAEIVSETVLGMAKSLMAIRIQQRGAARVGATGNPALH